MKYEILSSDHFIDKNPVRLPSEYDHEGTHLSFYGGTMFWDVATDIICIVSKVSLGAGDNLMAKISFK